MKKIKGVLEPFFETGTEGILWALYDDEENGYQSLHILNKSNYLKVFDKDGNIYWEGEIDLEYERNYSAYPLNPKYGQQALLGYWINGLQKNVEPEFWGKMFCNKMRAELQSFKD